MCKAEETVYSSENKTLPHMCTVVLAIHTEGLLVNSLQVSSYVYNLSPYSGFHKIMLELARGHMVENKYQIFVLRLLNCVNNC